MTTKELEFELYYAVKKNDVERVKELFRLHGKVDTSIKPYDQSLLLHAVLNGGKEITEYLVKNGFDVNEQDANGYRPLHAAAENGYSKLIMILANNGANPNVRDKKGNTPLSMAIFRAKDDLSVVKSLISAGADIKEKIYDDVDAIGMAKQFNNNKLVDYLTSVV
jgi:uncharacterized protein